LQLRNSYGETPFLIACQMGNLKTARYLLEIHPDSINVSDNDGYNCLHQFLSSQSEVDSNEQIIEFAGFLLEHSPGLISASTGVGDLLLHLAFKYGLCCLSAMQFLYNKYPEAIYTRNSDGLTPLDTEFDRNGYDYDDEEERDVMRHFFLDQLAIVNEARDVTTPVNGRGQLPIYLAMLNMNLPVGTIKLMIDANPQGVLAADEFGQTPLHIACQHRSINVIKLLLNADKDILLTPDTSGELPLHIACRSGKCDVVQWILKRTCAGLSVQNNKGMMPIQTLLYDADCDRNSLEWVQAVYALLRAHPVVVVHLHA
jgi:ankyrin repeat protein